MAEDYFVDFAPKYDKSNWMITVFENSEEENEQVSKENTEEYFNKNEYLLKVKEAFE